MVTLSATAQKRLRDVTIRHFGATGEELLGRALSRITDAPLKTLAYSQVAPLVRAMEEEAAAFWASGQSTALAAALGRRLDGFEQELFDRLEARLRRYLGHAARDLLITVCNRNGLSREDIRRGQIEPLIDTVAHDVEGLFGEDGAAMVRDALLLGLSPQPHELTAAVDALAGEHLGPDGAKVLRELCHSHLEMELEDMDIGAVRRLAQVIERGGLELGSDARISAFETDARTVLSCGSRPLQARIKDFAIRAVGPAGPDLLRNAAARNGLPYEAIEPEHLMWLAEVLRTEVGKVMGKKSGDELARQLRALLTGIV